jgi:multidrug efflux pump subunit AcrB
MMSRRQITLLASALLVVGAAIAVCILIRTLPAPGDDKDRRGTIEPASSRAPLVIVVNAFYPGANAQTVAATVAAPIEQQVNGVEHMLSMSSQSANDGSYTLHVTFEPGMDLDMAQVLVQNRVSFAMPVIPALVQREGISVRKQAPEPLVLVSLISPERRYDSVWLSNYATIHVKDELNRLPGVAAITDLGQRDHSLRAWLDPAKLATLGLTAMDVVAALAAQNVQVTAGQVGQQPGPREQQFQLTINTLGQLTEPGQLEGLIVKAGPDGRIVRLKDLARVELGSKESSTASLNGNPAVLLSIYPLPNARPGDVSRAVHDKLAELRADAPAGLSLAVAFDFAPNLEEPDNPATPEYLVIDAELPESASVERTARTLNQAAEQVRKTPGVQDVLALTAHPFALVRNRPCLVVRLTPKDQREIGREQSASNVRGVLQNHVPDAVFRVSVPSTAEGFPVYGFPIEFAIEDRGDHGSVILRECAEALVEKMNQSGKFSEVGIGSGLRSVPFLHMEIDRTKCQALEVQLSDVFNTLQVNLGSYYINDFNRFGRTVQVNVQVDPRFRDRVSAILQLQVKNKQNQLVRLGTVMEVRDTSGPMAIERYNMYPSARLTANLAAGVPLAEAKLLCETLAEQEFGTKQFKLIWKIR